MKKRKFSEISQNEIQKYFNDENITYIPTDDGKKHKNWIFVLNNYSDTEYNEIIDIPSKYKIVGKEVGKQGTHHLQGYICFKNARSFNAFKSIIGNRTHIAAAKGDFISNWDYCSKDGS